MCRLGAALTKLTAAVEAQASPPAKVAGMTSDKILEEATSHDATLLQPFSQFTVATLIEGKVAIVLVCTKDGKRGLLEDASCSASLDAHRWDDPSYPCGFTINTATACAADAPPTTPNLCN